MVQSKGDSPVGDRGNREKEKGKGKVSEMEVSPTGDGWIRSAIWGTFSVAQPLPKFIDKDAEDRYLIYLRENVFV